MGARLPGDARVVALDRSTPDVALAALTIGLHLPGRSTAAAFAMLAAAALTRETGLLLIAAWCVSRVVEFALAAAPALAWYGYVHARTQAFDYGAVSMPLMAIARAFANPASYPPEVPLQPLVHGAGFAALTGVALTFVLALLALRRDRSFPGLAAAAFALMGHHVDELRPRLLAAVGAARGAGGRRAAMDLGRSLPDDGPSPGHATRSPGARRHSRRGRLIRRSHRDTLSHRSKFSSRSHP